MSLSTPNSHSADSGSLGEMSLEMELEEEDDGGGDDLGDHEMTGLTGRTTPSTAAFTSSGSVLPAQPQPSPSDHPSRLLLQFLKLSWALYPRRVLAGSVTAVLLLLYLCQPWQYYYYNVDRHSLDQHYSHAMTMNDDESYQTLQQNYDQLAAQVDHWCLFGDNNQCQCQEITTGSARDDSDGWKNAHRRNKARLKNVTTLLDVVFLGDETFQVWAEGRFFDRTYAAGAARMFRDMFGGQRRRNRVLGKSKSSSSSSSASSDQVMTETIQQRSIRGMALGIYADQTSQVLWRLQHGELPPELHSKIFWILVGSNDLALALCSEDAVILGILRVAEELHFRNPDAIIVIQGLLPRSNHEDGSLEPNPFQGHKYHPQKRHSVHPFAEHSVWHERTNQVKQGTDEQGYPLFDTVQQTPASSAIAQARAQRMDPYFDYYIWPSIRAINAELKGFCQSHARQKFVYFDADDLLVKNQTTKVIATKYYREVEQRIIPELMPNHVLLSEQGHKVIMEAVGAKVVELLDGMENNNHGG